MTSLPTDAQWAKIHSFLRQHPRTYVGEESACRRFVEGVLWILRSGAQWRFLPEEYGNWNSVCKRYASWCDHGVWKDMHAAFVDDPDMESILIDSTVVRAHPCATGAQKKRGGQQAQALGRSRGGFSTKIHISVDALGNPLRFLVTGGQRHDSTQAKALVADFSFERVIADRAHDSEAFLELYSETECRSRDSAQVQPHRITRV